MWKQNFISEKWHLNHICTKVETLPENFFDFSIFGKSLVRSTYSTQKETPSALQVNNFKKAGFPTGFCKILKYGLPLLLKSLPPRRSMRNHPAARDPQNFVFVEKTLKTWEEMGVIKYTKEQPYIINPMNVVMSGTKKRLVMDATASGLNEHILAPKFKLPDVESIVSTLHVEDLMVKLDLASGFLQLPINESEQTYLGFQSPTDGRFGVIQRLPFGLRSAPFLFASFTFALQQAALKILNVRTQVYIDDWLLSNRNEDAITNDLNLFTELLDFLGVAIQHEKTEGPGRAITYLGMKFDTGKHCLALPEKKREKYLQGIQEILQETNNSMALLAKTAGRVVHIATIHRAGAANIQPLWEVIYREKKQWTKALLQKETLTLDEELKECLKWWEATLSSKNIERKFWKTPHGQFFLWSDKTAESFATFATTVCTDASDSGWGASTSVLTIAGKWSENQSKTSINWRELKTASLALNAWKFIRSTPVLLLTDSSTVVAAIRKRASKAEALQYLIKEMMKLEKKREIEVVAVHLPGSLNDLPDRLSRGLPTNTASVLSFNPLSLPEEVRNITQCVGLTWNENKRDTCPLERLQQLNVDTRPLLFALSTPDIPFIKIHLTKLSQHPAKVFIVVPRIPSSELPLELTRELETDQSPICVESDKTKWMILEVTHLGGTDVKSVM